MSKKYCPVCGIKRITDASFCAQCGHKFEIEQDNDMSYEMNYQTQVMFNDGGQTLLYNQPGHYQQKQQHTNEQYIYGSHFQASEISQKTQKIKKSCEFADFGTRFVAFIIDAIIIGMIGGILFWGADLGWFLSGIIAFGYYVLMEMNFNGGGQTIGKKIMKIRTVDATTFEPVHGKQAAIHALGKSFFLPLDIIIGFFAQEGREDKEQIRLTQILAETVVIKE